METNGKQWLAMMVGDIVHKSKYQSHAQGDDGQYTESIKNIMTKKGTPLIYLTSR